MSLLPANNRDIELAGEIAQYYADLHAGVLFVYPWGKPNTPLAHMSGPSREQARFLDDLSDEIKARKFDGIHPVESIEMAVTSGHGGGKALSKRTIVPTPSGAREWGTLRAGDYVFAEDGSATKVLATYDQGDREMYQVRFDDGTVVEADGDHLWKIRDRQGRRTRKGWRIATTREIVPIIRRLNGKSTTRQVEIPQQGPAQYPLRQGLSIPPYALGVWLGDGTRNKSEITSADQEIIDRLRILGESVEREPSMPHGWWVSMLLPRLRELGIADRYSYQKSVPVAYLENSIESRAELLRGLLDTDGECSRHGPVSFNSTSLALAKDVIWLVRSLGGVASMRPTVKRGSYVKNGVKVECRDCWRVSIAMPSGFRYFYVARKQSRINPSRLPRTLTRWIDKIEPIGKLPAMCITVDHTSHCYLANDFAVTHNTELIGMLSGVLMVTRDGMHGTVTANNGQQLRDKTWASIQKYKKLLICAHWFDITTEKFWRIGRKEDWFMTAVTWKEENADAFQGQHAAQSSSVYIFDEDSNIPDSIHTAAEGGTIHGEAMLFRFGNCTRRDGNFYQRCFGSKRNALLKKTLGPSRDTAQPASLRRWDTSKTEIRNDKKVAEWAEEYGRDSDFYRVRVEGLPPNAGDLQWIPADWIAQARNNLPRAMSDDALIAGVDCSWGGDDPMCIRFRRGLDARTVKPIYIPGSQTKDPAVGVTKCADVLDKEWDIGGGRRMKVAMMFVDSAGSGDLICRRLRELGYKNVVAVNFGGHSPDKRYKLVRSYMWGQLKNDMQKLAIDESDNLQADLEAPGYTITKDSEWLLEPKQDIRDRLGHSTDDGDALALTYYAPVRSKEAEEKRKGRQQQQPSSVVSAWS